MKNFFERHRRLISWLVTVPMLVILFRTPISEASPWSSVMEYGGFAMLIVAAVGRIWTSLFICNRKDTELVTDGPFSVCRNPLYLFSFIGAVGLMLAAENPWLAALMVPVFWGYYHFVIRGEERRLAGIFGSAYEAYREKTPRVFPRLSNYRSRESVQVTLPVMNRAILDASLFLVLILLVELLEEFKLGM